MRKKDHVIDFMRNPELEQGMDAHAQAQFFSTDFQFSIPDSQFSIPVSVTRVELNDILAETLHSSNSESTSTPIKQEFDFLIKDKLVTDTLEKHIAENQLSTEEVLQIECVKRNPKPSLTHEMDHKDWVSGLHCYKNLILTGCYDNCVRVWTKNGDLICEAEGHTAPIKAVRWISEGDGEYLFLSASQDQNVLLWRLTLHTGEAGDGDSPTGHVTLVHQCKGHAGSVEAIDVSSDKSKFCSVSWDSYVKIWSTVPDDVPLDEVEQESDLPAKKPKFGSESQPRATTRTPLVTLKGHTKSVTAVVWAGEGVENGAELGNDIITGGWDNCIRVWDVANGVNKITLNGSKVFHSIDWSELNHLIASGNSDKFVRLWDPRQKESSVIQSSLSSHNGWVVCVKWSPCDPYHLLSGSYDSTLRLWDTRSTKKPLFTVLAHEGKVLCCDWSDPKCFFSGGTDHKLRTFQFS